MAKTVWASLCSPSTLEYRSDRVTLDFLSIHFSTVKRVKGWTVNMSWNLIISLNDQSWRYKEPIHQRRRKQLRVLMMMGRRESHWSTSCLFVWIFGPKLSVKLTRIHLELPWTGEKEHSDQQSTERPGGLQPHNGGDCSPETIRYQQLYFNGHKAD